MPFLTEAEFCERYDKIASNRRYFVFKITAGMDRKILSEEKFPNYVVKQEQCTMGDDEPVNLESAYTHYGDYIGNPDMAKFICDKMKILPQLACEGDNICTIGFCPDDGKWYGWSHRAIVGFRIGDRLFEQDYPEANDDTLFTEYGDKVIVNRKEAKQAAINFADSIG
jgi:hypothetical protein